MKPEANQEGIKRVTPIPGEGTCPGCGGEEFYYVGPLRGWPGWQCRGCGMQWNTVRVLGVYGGLLELVERERAHLAPRS